MDQQGNAVEAEDFRDDYYCEHGKFTGNPYGGDYMCHFCELGYSREEYEAYCRSISASRAREYLKAEVFGVMLRWGMINTFLACLTTSECAKQYCEIPKFIDAMKDEEALAAEEEWRAIA